MKSKLPQTTNLTTISKALYLITLLSITFVSNAQWLPVSFSSNQTVVKIAHTSEKTVWGHGIGLQTNFFFSHDGGNTFEYQTSPTFKRVFNFNAMSDSIAYFIGAPAQGGDNRLFKTVDSGKNWDSISTPPSIFFNNPLVHLVAFDSLNLCLLSPNKSNGCTEIWVSTNGGSSWNPVICDSIFGTPDNSFYAFNEINKFNSTAIVGGDSSMFVTYNFGKSWTILNNPHRIAFTTFMDSLNGIGYKGGASPNYYSSVHRSKDGGLTWDSIPQQFESITSAAFVKDSVDSRSFYLLGHNNGSYFSQDSGNTWKIFDGRPHARLSFYNSKSGLSYSSTEGMYKYVGPITGLSNRLNKYDRNIFPFPNPSDEVVSFTGLTPNKTYKLVIQDITGKEMMNRKITDEDNINVSTLEAGYYFYQLLDQNETYSNGKLIID